MECLKNQTFQDFEWLVEVGLPHKGCDLSASLNRMLKRANGELIVMLQDFIAINPDALQKFWDLYQEHPKTLFTAPKGVVESLEEFKLMNKINAKWDWRIHGIMRELQPTQWEADWASAPRQAFFDVGGYDEEYDQGWSWENAEIGVRMAQFGYNFMVDPENQALGFDHNKESQHPFNNPQNLNNHRFEQTKRKLESGLFKLEYL